MKSNKIRIINALIAQAKTGKFYEVVRGAGETAGQEDIDTTTATEVTPVGITCNETNIRFGADENNGMMVAQKVNTWTFSLKLEFQHETTLEFFIERITNPIIKLPRTSEYSRFAFIRLTDAEIEHPVHRNPSTGTRANLIFEVEVGRA